MKQATSVIPIVFAVSGDPVGTGLVATLARPGGNVTGLSLQSTDIVGKRIELLHEIVPGFHRLAILANPGSPNVRFELPEVQAGARTLGFDTATFEIRRAEDIESAFEALKSWADALYVVTDPLVFTNRIRVNTLALEVRLPTIYGFRESLDSGGLMSYGPNLPDLYRRTAEIVDQILRGTRPADIPVEQPTKFELVVNLATAKALDFFGFAVELFERASSLTDDLPPGGCAFYHVHSFAARPCDPEAVVGTTEYGERFGTIVARENVFGVQFHPEKSSRNGLSMLHDFVGICASVRA